MSYELINADCLEAMQGMEECSIDACVTDPPYGLGEVKNLPGLLEAWMTDECDKKHIGKSGFMSREWDAGVPSPRYWKEVYKVMKPGAHLLCFASTRTWDLMSLSIRLAGFENRDTIRHHQGVPSLAWITGSGFPKGHDVSAAIDRLAGNARQNTGVRRPEQRIAYGEGAGALRCIECGNLRNGTSCKCELPAPSTEEAKKWAGWNCALKPAWEVILVFRKPLSESSIARQVLKTSTGALAIDKCRVGVGEDVPGGGGWTGTGRHEGYQRPAHADGKPTEAHNKGRWPANLLLSHHESCQRIGTKRVSGDKRQAKNGKGDYGANFMDDNWKPKAPIKTPAYGDPDGLEEVESWECARDEGGNYICPVALLDLQSGNRPTSKPGMTHQGPRYTGHTYNNGVEGGGQKAYGYGDQGGASRFFQQFHEPDTGPGFFYSAKASRRERTANGTVANGHPTVKNLSLMRYLVRLVTPPSGTVLDCFCGSATTGIAAIEEGFKFIGIDSEDEYIEIARARLAHHQSEIEKASEEKLFA